MRFNSKLIRPLILTALVILIVLVAALLLLQTPAVKRLALRTAQDYLHRSLGVDLTASRFDYNLLGFSLELEDVALTSSTAPDLPPVLKIDNVYLQIRLRPLLGGSFFLEEGQLVGVSVNAIVDEAGRTNIPRPPSGRRARDPEAAVNETSYVISRLQIYRGSFSFEDRQRSFLALLPQWRLEITGDALTFRHSVRLTSERPATVRFERKTLPVQHLNLEAALGGNDLHIETFQLDSNKSRLQFSGTVKDFARPMLDLKMSSSLDLEEAAGLAGLKKELHGKLETQVDARGPVDHLKITARIGPSQFNSPEFGKGNVNASASWDSRSGLLHLQSVAIGSPQGLLEGQGAVNTFSDRAANSAQLRLHDLNLEWLSKQMRLPVRVASNASGTLNAQWVGWDLARAGGSGRFRLNARRPLAEADLLPVSGNLSLEAHDDQIELLASISSLASNLEGNIQLRSRNTLSGKIRGEVNSLASLLSQLEGLLGKPPGTFMAVPVEGAARLEGGLSGTVDRPKLSALMEVPAARVGNLENVNLRVSTDLSSEDIVVQEGTLTWQEGSMLFRGSLGTRSPDSPLRAELEIPKTSVASLAAAFGQSTPVEGHFQATARLIGSRQQPQATLNLTTENLRAYQESLGHLSVEAGFVPQRFNLVSLRLSKPSAGSQPGTLEASGEYDFVSREYVLDANARGFRIEALTLPNGSPVRGNVNFSLAGRGSIDNPNLDLGLKAEDVSVSHQSLGSMEITGKLQNEETILEAHLPRFNLNAKTRLLTELPYPLEVELHTRSTDVSLFGIKLTRNELLKGAVTARVTANGNVQDWRAGTASLQVEDLSLTSGDQTIRNQGPLNVQYAGHTLKFDSFALVAQDALVQIEGQLPVNASIPAGSLNLKGQTDLGTVFAFLPSLPELYSSGGLTFDVSLNGTLRNLVPAGHIRLQDGFLYSPALLTPLTEMQAHLEVKEGALLLNDLTTQWALGTVKISGSLPLGLLPADLPGSFPRQTGPARLLLEADNLQPEGIPTLPREVSGLISLQMKAEAPRLDLSALQASVLFEELQFTFTEFNIKESEPSRISVSEGVARIEQFNLAGPTGSLRLRGQAGLTQNRPLDFHAEGDLELGMFTFLLEDLSVRGDTKFRLDLVGSVESPALSGFLEVQDGLITLDSPRIQADNLKMQLNIDRNRLTVEQLTGDLNGGTLEAKGSVAYAEAQLRDVALNVKLNEIFLQFPEDLKTVSSASLVIRSEGKFTEVGGEVRILEGSYAEALLIETEVLEYLRSKRGVAFTEERSPFLDQIRYNVAIVTEGPVVVDNNLAKAVVEANLRLTGTYHRPGLTGRMTLEEGGEIYFNQKRYILEQGAINFTSQTAIEPSLDILARTKASGYEIDLRLTGTLKDLQTTFTSDPALPEPDIISVLLTGKTLDQFRGAELDVAKAQTLSYLTGTVGSRVAQGVERTLGLSRVRIEPSLIAEETDPGSRLTVGQDLTKDLRLIYSMNLTDSQDQIWIAEYDLTKRFQTRAIKQEDNSYRYEFQHNLLFGGPPSAGRASDLTRPKRQIGQVMFTGTPVVPEKKLVDKLGVEPGDKYDFFKVRKGLDRLDKFYADQNRFEADVRMSRDTEGNQVNLKLDIQAGPQIEFVFEGAQVSDDVKKQIRIIWREGIFDGQRAEEAITAIRRWLVEQSYLESKVEYRIENPSPDRKQVIFRIALNTKYDGVEVVFEGNSVVESKELKEQLEKAKLHTELYVEPNQVQNFLARYYREQGFLNAKIESPSLEANSQTRSARVVIQVEEGTPFKVGEIRFEGNQHWPAERLQQTIPLSPGLTYQPKLLQDSLVKLEELYWSDGFNEVSISHSLNPRVEAGLVDLVFDLTEGQQSIVREVTIEGNEQTSDRFIRGQVEVSAGKPLDSRKVNLTRRSLYNTGAYSVIDITTEPLEDPEAESGQKPVRLRIKVREIKPYDLRYGAFYDTERGPGVSTAWTHRNFFGSARVLGASARYDRQFQQIRGYFSQPFVRRLRLQTNVSAYVQREDRTNLSFIEDTEGFFVQQEAQLKYKFLFSYGYRYERSHVFDRDPDPSLPLPFDETLSTAGLTGTLSRDTRNDLLDAARGSFLSHGLEFSSTQLGADIPFIKYFGQYFRYWPLAESSEIPFQSGLKQTRLVFATGIRAGLAKGLSGFEVPRSKRFFAGGGTSLRGFEQNRVGPMDPFGDPAGGEGVLILNNEIRFPIISIFDGVGFVDLGNVYRRLEDFNPLELRKSAGLGLRLRTPFILLRADFGFKLDRQPGESRGSFFFSIGQAF